MINTTTGTTATECARAALLMTIKGTALNKGRARVWIESDKLAQYGFTRGARIDITLRADSIAVALNDSGARKVAGRERGGRTICILDICFYNAQRAAMFHGAAELEVYARYGVLIIRAVQS